MSGSFLRADTIKQRWLMGTRQPVHFSAYEKMHFGWISPALVDLSAWTTHDVPLGAVETSQEALILYNPARNDTEFFMIENRFRGPLPGIANYDSFLNASAGPVLWHIVEDVAALNPAFPPPTANPATWPMRLATYGWPAGGIQDWGVITMGTSVTLKWADGTPVGATVVGGLSGATSVVTIKKP